MSIKNQVNAALPQLAKFKHLVLAGIESTRRSHADAQVRRMPRARTGRHHGLGTEVVVSLTSYPPRYPTLHKTITSILQQSTIPDRIILWISHADFAAIPPSVTALAPYGLEIRKCDDLRSYKKIVPAIQQFPHSIIVTADDDVYYPRNWLQELIKTHRSHPTAVVGTRAHVAARGQTSWKPYLEWEYDTRTQASPPQGGVLFFTGVGGVLYPPNSLHPDVVNVDLFQRICPLADDIWLFAMQLKAGSHQMRTKRRFKWVCWEGSQINALATENVTSGENDRQLEKVTSHFPEIIPDGAA